jgi:hypothetical protein
MTVVIVIVVAIVIIAAVAQMTRRRRLQEQFGPEYDRAVTENNGRLRAEAELTSRQRRVSKFDIRPLSEAARTRYEADWTVIQEQFVDSPQTAVAEAYELLITVMADRGYPTDDDEQVLADLSVEHGQTVGHFRAAQEISKSSAAGQAATEDLRQAFIHYRALFADLLGVADAPQAGTTAAAAVAPATNPAPAPTEPDSIVVGAPAADLPDSQR